MSVGSLKVSHHLTTGALRDVKPLDPADGLFTSIHSFTTGEVGRTSFAVPKGSLKHWGDRLAQYGAGDLETDTHFGDNRLTFFGRLVDIVEDDLSDPLAQKLAGILLNINHMPSDADKTVLATLADN